MKRSKKILLLGVCITAIIAFGGCKAEKTETKPSTVVEQSVSDVDYDRFVGEYQDSYSQRAGMEIKKNPDGEGLLIHIHWGSSANENTQWDMTATYRDGQLVYSDGLKTEHMMKDESSEEIVKTLEENQKGYFEVKDGILNWTGAPEESCQACAFEKCQ